MNKFAEGAMHKPIFIRQTSAQLPYFALKGTYLCSLYLPPHLKIHFRMATLVQPIAPLVTDSFPLKGTDFIEFYVGNAKQSAMYYQAALGFRLVAYKGPETGEREFVSYVLQQNKIRIVLTSALRNTHPVAQHVFEHGDGVKVLALWVDDAAKSFHTAIERGAKPAFEPITTTDAHGSVTVSGIHTYGETIHTFVERTNYTGAFMPGYEARNTGFPAQQVGLEYVDHCVGNVELGMMNHWL
jgi:4-hydroxyphenylpyruvate dioxygenase